VETARAHPADVGKRSCVQDVLRTPLGL
jgi:hypothetical protein